MTSQGYEVDGRLRALVAVVKDAQNAEELRLKRLRRAKSAAEIVRLEKRFEIERKNDARRVQDLNQERLDFSALSKTVSVSPSHEPAKSRDIPGSLQQDFTFYKQLYKKLEPKRTVLDFKKHHRLLSEKQLLLDRLDLVLKEEQGLLLSRNNSFRHEWMTTKMKPSSPATTTSSCIASMYSSSSSSSSSTRKTQHMLLRNKRKARVPPLSLSSSTRASAF